MNKSDLRLIFFIFFVSIILLLSINLIKENSDVALVYYENKIIKEIDLTVNATYKVKGYNGDVIIEVKDNKIRVVEENSQKNLCSIQGYISNSNESIVCLPNKIVITIMDNVDYDTIIR